MRTWHDTTRPTWHLRALCLALALLGWGCGSGPSALATRVHEDARIAERMVDTRPGAAARRFVDAGAGIDALVARHPGHPLTEELQRGDAVGGIPRPLFEARLAAARRALGPADLLDAAISLLPPPRRGLARVGQAPGPRAVDRLRAALTAAGRSIPEAVSAHGPPQAAPSPTPPALPAPIPVEPGALARQWRALRGHPDADLWFAAALDRIPRAQRFVWARAVHRGWSWTALAARLLSEGDRDGAAQALDFAIERSLIEGLGAPMRGSDWLPAALERTLRAAGRAADADRLLATYAAGLARVRAVPDNGIDGLDAKAEALAARAVEVGDPVAAAWLGDVLRRDLLAEVRRRARRPGADPTVVAAQARVAAMGPAERAEPTLAAVRAMAPALAAAAAAHGGRVTPPDLDAVDGLEPADRIVAHLAFARLEPGEADRHLGAALDAAAAVSEPADRVDALVGVEAVRAALGRPPGPRLRAGLARVLFTSTP